MPSQDPDQRLIEILEGELADRLKSLSENREDTEDSLKKIWMLNSDVPQTSSSDPCKLIQINTEYLKALKRK